MTPSDPFILDSQMMRRYCINVETLISITLMLIIFTASYAYANSAIPGPLLIVEWAHSADPLRWIAVTMFMCIGIEGAIYDITFVQNVHNSLGKAGHPKRLLDIA